MVDVEITQIQPVEIVPNPIDPQQIVVEQIKPIELIPLHNVGEYGTKFSKILGNVFTVSILQTEHNLESPIGIFLFTASGTNVSAEWSIIGTTVNVFSNINLLNHKLIIF